MNHFKTRGVKSMRALCVFFGMAGTLFATDPVPANPDLTKVDKNMIDFRAGQAMKPLLTNRP